MLMNEYHYNKIPGVHGSVIGELLINSLCVVDSSKVYHKCYSLPCWQCIRIHYLISISAI